ncbi:MAG TPA: nucleoside triphosphate pyrophosphatase [Dehalococcoidales bacterium]|jgi:septum formation protein|nr:nucleoside triphosphate pyrophosphatase [Dehalococcoidales bacterium]
MKRIILASASPRRKELLEKIGLKFEVDASNCAEEIDPALEPDELVRGISLAKAKSVSSRHKDALIIAADTIGVIGKKLLGKPHTAVEARKMLAQISGKSHEVITGFTVLDTATNKVFSGTVNTKVYIKKLTRQEIAAYVRTGEPLDKAGAYGIQGLGAVIVEKIEGDYYNVMGLPLNALTNALKEFGISVLENNLIK